ncbi:zinc-binding dehydrogenase [Pseudonocardia adelaidensis]|uniref:Alcohol dehydrogenase-like C-terminal domain-containing protein n=1 Tax=Pseudonocardia adelaidensis TaxID=648754 RepID=A0ABP9NA57_9PSEU
MVAVDVSADALALARARGAEVVVDASGTRDVPAAVHELTGGGAHVSLDALGSLAAMDGPTPAGMTVVALDP